MSRLLTLDELADLHVDRFPLLESAVLATQEGATEREAIWSLTLVLRPWTTNEPARLRITCAKVRELKLGPIAGSIENVRLSILSIREWQWEGCAYRVRNEEDLDLSFYCSDIEASIEPVTQV